MLAIAIFIVKVVFAAIVCYGIIGLLLMTVFSIIEACIRAVKK